MQFPLAHPLRIYFFLSDLVCRPIKILFCATGMLRGDCQLLPALWGGLPWCRGTFIKTLYADLSGISENWETFGKWVKLLLLKKWYSLSISLVIYEETFKKFNTIFQPLLENWRFFKCSVFWDQGRRIKRVCCSVLSLPFPLYQRMKLFPFLLEYLMQKQCCSRWVLCAVQHLISTNMNFHEITFLMFPVLKSQIPSDRGCKDEWNFRLLRHWWENCHIFPPWEKGF